MIFFHKHLSYRPHIIGLLLLPVLLVAILVTVLIIRQQQEIRQQAATTSNVTVSIDLSKSTGTSKLNVGVTHVFEGIAISGTDPAAKASAENLLKQGISFENRHILCYESLT